MMKPMRNRFGKGRQVAKFEFGGNMMTRIFFPLILFYFVAISRFSLRFGEGLNRKVNK